jgi:hypothetical protein
MLGHVDLSGHGWLARFRLACCERERLRPLARTADPRGPQRWCLSSVVTQAIANVQPDAAGLAEIRDQAWSLVGLPIDGGGAPNYRFIPFHTSSDCSIFEITEDS